MGESRLGGLFPSKEIYVHHHWCKNVFHLLKSRALGSQNFSTQCINFCFMEKDLGRRQKSEIVEKGGELELDKAAACSELSVRNAFSLSFCSFLF